MEDGFVKPTIAILTAIIGVAIVAVLVSKNANTTSVISSFTQGFSQILGVAISPVSGGSTGGFGSILGGSGGSSFLTNPLGSFLQ